MVQMEMIKNHYKNTILLVFFLILHYKFLILKINVLKSLELRKEGNERKGEVEVREYKR